MSRQIQTCLGIVLPKRVRCVFGQSVIVACVFACAERSHVFGSKVTRYTCFGRCLFLFRPTHIIARAGWMRSAKLALSISPWTAARAPQLSRSDQTVSPRMRPWCTSRRLWHAACGGTARFCQSVCSRGGHQPCMRLFAGSGRGERTHMNWAAYTTPPSTLLAQSWRKSGRCTSGTLHRPVSGSTRS